ncbi:MAG: L-2-amino-thiazoline-4-carboxylic acid hydrolase [Lachnospiraceae bacterium]|nr:L-2-amino-thiazoline-4-carboxylic acid hydrolase [Lachnospiraceae bacterium]
MSEGTVSCKIEHHATIFALMSKYAQELRGEEGRDAILAGMDVYGNERGRRMAANAAANGDKPTTIASQIYGEWKPDYPGQMDFGRIRTTPTLQTYIAKCAWCDAWKKYDLLEFGKLYCVNIDNAWYQGFNPDFLCTPIATALSFGGERCEFDWGAPVTDEDISYMDEKKKEIGTSCMKDFNYHTAHILSTISKMLVERLGADGEKAVTAAKDEYVSLFGQEYLDVLEGIYP